MNSKPYHSPLRRFGRRFRVWSQKPGSRAAVVFGGAGAATALHLLNLPAVAAIVAALVAVLVLWMVRVDTAVHSRRLAESQAALDRELSRR